jgi:hypothetical protein
MTAEFLFGSGAGPARVARARTCRGTGGSRTRECRATMPAVWRHAAQSSITIRSNSTSRISAAAISAAFMWAVRDWHQGQRAAGLSLDSFRCQIDEQIGLVEIKLQRLGEPTMLRDDYFAIVGCVRTGHLGAHHRPCLAAASERQLLQDDRRLRQRAADLTTLLTRCFSTSHKRHL